MKKYYPATWVAALATAALLLFPVFSGSSALQPSAFGSWELTTDGKDFVLATRALKNRGVILRLAGNFNIPFPQLASALDISVSLAGEDAAEFDEGKTERCVIFVDGHKFVTHTTMKRSFIHIDGTELGAALLASSHENFVIGFPAVAVSWTFPVAGFRQAMNRIRVLQEQMGIAERNETRKTFGNAASIVIVAAGLLAFALFAWKRFQSRGNAHVRAEQSGTDGPQAARKEKKRRTAASSGKTHANARKEYRAEAGRAYSWQQAGAGRRDDFFERATFSGTSGRGANLPDDVRRAFEFFGLPESAAFDEVHKKRNFMLKAYHPDRFENDAAARAQAEDETKQINLNFDILARHFKG